MANTFTKKTAAIALAAGLAFSGSAGTVFAPVAQAQTLQTINNGTATLNIHKLVNPDQINETTNGKPANAQQLAGAGDPLAGAVFEVQKLDLDLTTNAGFEAASKLTPQEAANAEKDGNSFQMTTDANGLATRDGLAAGVYLVTEKSSQALEDALKESNETLVPAAPFVVFLPMADSEAEDGWNRDVHVYPKNSKLKTEKTVVDVDKQPVKGENEKLVYTINSDARVLPENRTYAEYNVVDSYNSKELLNAAITNVTLDGQKLEEGTDYEVVSGTTGQATAPKVADATLTVSFLPAGLSKLNSLSKSGKVAVTLEGNVAPIVADGGNGLEDGEVTNEARTTGKTLVTGDPSEQTEEFETPESTVNSYFGAIQVVKKDEEGNLLDGAEFDLYKIPSGKTCGPEARKDAQVVLEKFPVANGKAVINGLHVTDFVDNKSSIDDTYCLVEVTAPKGYQLSDEHQALKLTTEDVTSNKQVDGAGDAAQVFHVTKDIENKKLPEFTLPGTGGMGVLALILAGLALLGGGAYAARRKTA